MRQHLAVDDVVEVARALSRVAARALLADVLVELLQRGLAVGSLSRMERSSRWLASETETRSSTSSRVDTPRSRKSANAGTFMLRKGSVITMSGNAPRFVGDVDVEARGAAHLLLVARADLAHEGVLGRLLHGEDEGHVVVQLLHRDELFSMPDMMK